VSDPIKVLLADDQALVRGAMSALLSLESDLEVVAEVDRGDQVVAAVAESQADVAVIDIEMPGIDGLAASAALRTQVPSCRVLIVTTFGRPGYLRRAMESGVSGFVVKDAPASELADAIRRVHAGLQVVDPTLAASTLATGNNPLTPREIDVLRASRDGASIAGIADRLFLGEGTVRNYLSSAISKTATRNRIEAVRVAEQNGWL
jgi:two-component system, NarL family, response regulator DesR